MTSHSLARPLTSSLLGATSPAAHAVSSVSLAAVPSSSADARAWIDLELHRRGVTSGDLRDDVTLAVSELVSNAVQHGSSPIVLTVRRTPVGLELSVEDGGAPPHLFGRRPLDVTASHGRGLRIVASIATAWGIRSRPSGAGKAVWCELRDPDAGRGVGP